MGQFNFGRAAFSDSRHEAGSFQPFSVMSVCPHMTLRVVPQGRTPQGLGADVRGTG